MIYYFDNRYILIGLFFLFIVLAGYVKIIRKKNNRYLFYFSIMYLYICAVVKVTQFPIYASESMKAVIGGQNVWKEMNWIPFKTILEGLSVDIFLNIIMTIPLGIGLPFLVRCSWKKVIIAGVIVGVLCETGQLLSALWVGFTFRHVNIDDVILNLTGTLLGYTLYKVFCYIFRQRYLVS